MPQVNHTAPPIALTIAGSDSSSGAGIQADLKTFRAFGVYGLNAVTCIVAETANKVCDIHPIPTASIDSQIDILLESYPVNAIKIGMLYSKEIAETVATKLEQALKKKHIPIILDPVMLASTGDSLINEETIRVYKEQLIPKATIITPNIPEALKLLEIETTDFFQFSQENITLEFYKAFGVNTVIKGGHRNEYQAEDHEAVDYYYDGDELKSYSLPRLSISSAHGTGCTYAAALTAEIAKNNEAGHYSNAVESAKNFVHQSIANSHQWHSGTDKEIFALDQ